MRYGCENGECDKGVIHKDSSGYFILIWMCGFNIGKQVVGKSSFKCLIKVRHLLKSPVQNKGNFYNIYITKKHAGLSKASSLIVPFLSFHFVLVDRCVFLSKP